MTKRLMESLTMPIYDYKCQGCNHLFEAMVTLADRNKEQECPECGGSGKHIITPVNFQLPGNRLDYPGAAMKWERDHDRRLKQEKKKSEEQAKDLASSMY